MIDFRYHLVSLAAVFLALAAGIVLGSGPLRTALVEQLSNETDDLRTLLAESQQQVADQEREGAIGEAFVVHAEQVLTGDRLADQNIAIVRIDGPDDADVTGMRDRIVAAGGTVSANLTIEDAWTDDDQVTFRSALALSIADNVVGVDSTTAPDRLLAHTLAQALIADEFPDGFTEGAAEPEEGTVAPEPITDSREVLLGLLKEAGLVSGTVTGDVDAVLFIMGDGPEDDDLQASQSEVFAELMGVVDEYADAVVVATGAPTESDVPTAIQSSALLATRITTVADAMNFYGHFAVALAVDAELAGQTGHYGYGDDVELFPVGVPIDEDA